MLNINLKMDIGELMPMLLPSYDLSEMNNKDRNGILTLRNIISQYMSFVPENNKIIIKSSKDVAKLMHPLLKGKEQEELWLITLNRANAVIKKECISTGGLDSTVIDNRVILTKALKSKSSNIILVHNHPSGNPVPGKSDIEMTTKLSKAGKIMDISLLDHVIISDNSFYSFAEEKSLLINF